MGARWRASGTTSNVSGASGYAAAPTPSYRGLGSRRSCSVILCLLCAWFTAFTVTQRELDLEEPDAEILHVRICGSPSGAIPGATRQLLNDAAFSRSKFARPAG